MSARTQLADELDNRLPKINVLKVEEMPDALSRPTIVVRFHEYTPAPNAQGSMFATFVVTVASHHKDRSKAEDALDGLLDDVLGALHGISTATWARARKALMGQYLAFDIDVTLPTNPA